MAKRETRDRGGGTWNLPDSKRRDFPTNKKLASRYTIDSYLRPPPNNGVIGGNTQRTRQRVKAFVSCEDLEAWRVKALGFPYFRPVPFTHIARRRDMK